MGTRRHALLSPASIGSLVAAFMDVELVSVVEAESPDAYVVTFDVIYGGETWCRSIVGVEDAMAACLAREEAAMIRAARDALLELLAVELGPVSFRLRLTTDGTVVLAQAVPGGGPTRSRKAFL